MATYLKFKPKDKAVIDKVTLLIQYVADQIDKKKLGLDYTGYKFRFFAKKAVFLAEFIPEDVKNNFVYIMEKNSNNFHLFWK